MPYIDPSDRLELEPNSTRQALTPGELNFQITSLCDGYLLEGAGLDYQALNDVAGVLACVQQELYRRIAAPYEDQKIQVNGDVLLTKVRPIGRKERVA